eukprot:m.346398 g.346398  ORF g.346398 m.346398 type:complete len:188 (-) comp55832_c0_seq1:1141-1704(-)
MPIVHFLFVLLLSFAHLSACFAHFTPLRSSTLHQQRPSAACTPLLAISIRPSAAPLAVRRYQARRGLNFADPTSTTKDIDSSRWKAPRARQNNHVCNPSHNNPSSRSRLRNWRATHSLTNTTTRVQLGHSGWNSSKQSNSHRHRDLSPCLQVIKHQSLHALGAHFRPSFHRLRPSHQSRFRNGKARR